MFASKHDLPGRLLLKLVDTITSHKKQALLNFEQLKQQSPSKVSNNYYKPVITPMKTNSNQSSQILNKLSSNVPALPLI